MKKIKRYVTRNFSCTDVEVQEAELEFAKLLTQSWEAIYKKPSVHAKAVQTAKKIRELKALLAATGQISHSIH